MKLTDKQKEELREKIRNKESLILSNYGLLTGDKPLHQRIEAYRFNLELLCAIQTYKYLLGEGETL